MTGPGAGDKAADTSGDSFQYEVRSWLWLSELQAFKADAPDRRTIVAIGDSITDGSGTTVDGHDRWTDFLNRRLRAAGSKNVVVNAGIGGNRITTLRWGPVIGRALVLGRSRPMFQVLRELRARAAKRAASPQSPAMSATSSTCRMSPPSSSSRA